MIQDHATADRQRLINEDSATIVTQNEFKRMRALSWLGSRWVLHKANSVKRRTPIKASA